MHKRYGFELIRNSPEEKVFRTTCDCGDPDDDCEVHIIYDKENRELLMQLFVNTFYVPYWWDGELNIFQKLTKRIKGAFHVLIGKSLQYETSFIFRGRSHIEDFSDMIFLLGKECKKESNELEEYRKKLRKYEKI